MNKKNRFEIFYVIYISKSRGSKGLTITEIANQAKLKPETINNKKNLPFLIEKFLVMESKKHRGRYLLSKPGHAAMGIIMKEFIKHLKGVNNQTVEEILVDRCSGRDMPKKYKCIIDELRKMAPSYLNWLYDSSHTFFNDLYIFSTFTRKPKGSLDTCNVEAKLRCFGNVHSIYKKPRGKIPVEIIKPSGYHIDPDTIGFTLFTKEGIFDWHGKIPKESKQGTYKFIARYQLTETDWRDPDVGFGKWVEEFKVKPCK